MKMKSLIIAGVSALALGGLSLPATAQTFKFAFQADAGSLDPHALFETFTIGLLANIYEPLVAYDRDMVKVPRLATDWEIVSPTVWRFNLRQDVKFQNGNDFTAEDVLFSWERMGSEGSDLKSVAATIKNITIIDDYTIEIETPVPNPIFLNDLTGMFIMDKEWSVANNTTEASSPADAGRDGSFATSNTNGTGPFMLESRQPDVKTVLVRYDDHWNTDIATNVQTVEFTPIGQAATRVAALLSGQIDMVYPVPVQDWDRLNNSDGVNALAGPEARTIFLGMDQSRDELLYSSVKGANPFKDPRVRHAFSFAIDVNAIKETIMRGAATPAGLMWAPQIQGFNAEANTPHPFDPDKARSLLADAGYADGFTVTMDCPNDRYVNDEKICQAVAGMLAKVGVTIDLLAQPKSLYFAKVLAQSGYDTSFYLLGWTPGTMDVQNVFSFLLACRNEEGTVGGFNLGGYCNARVDELGEIIASETDVDIRQAAIDEAAQILKADAGYIPLFQQPLSWGVRDGVSVAQRADNVLDLRNVVMP
ncbi:MAG: ABC transporter substrate-binding protein [Devosiaceae bacterium]|nr:ABC transporter substrate-binding protein [Devosiaceae bacterium]